MVRIKTKIMTGTSTAFVMMMQLKLETKPLELSGVNTAEMVRFDYVLCAIDFNSMEMIDIGGCDLTERQWL